MNCLLFSAMPTWLMRPPEMAKNTKSPPCMSDRSTGAPTAYMSAETRGSEMPCCWKQYDTNPEQSKQSGVEPALQYDVPMRSIACSITGLMARGSLVRIFEDEQADRRSRALNANA